MRQIKKPTNFRRSVCSVMICDIIRFNLENVASSLKNSFAEQAEENTEISDNDCNGRCTLHSSESKTNLYGRWLTFTIKISLGYPRELSSLYITLYQRNHAKYLAQAHYNSLVVVKTKVS